MKNTILLLFLTLLFSTAFAQIEINDNCADAYRDILSLKFKSAEKLIAKEKTNNPDNLYPYYLENYIYFLKVFISEDENNFKKFDELKVNFKSKIESLPDSSPYKNYLLANMNLQWAFARLKFGEYFSAAIEINRAYRLMDNNVSDFPSFYPNHITHAVLKIIVGLVPDNYKWILNLVSMDGSVEDGKAELYNMLKAAQKIDEYNYLEYETLFYLGFIELNINPDKQNSLKLLEQIEPLSDKSSLFNYMTVNILTRTGQHARAQKHFENKFPDSEYFPFWFMDYLRADFYLKEMKIDSSRKYFKYFLDNFKGRNYTKDAWRKLAWTYLITDKVDLYKQNMQKVSKVGNTDIGMDKEAQFEYEEGITPNKYLIMARLYFDGYDYQSADSVLNLIENSNLDFDQMLEKKYRRSRIYHESGKEEYAKPLYKSVSLASELTLKYYPANSALKLAELYESQDSLKLAKYYYDKISEMDFAIFENSIKSKAREGSRRVSKLIRNN